MSGLWGDREMSTQQALARGVERVLQEIGAPDTMVASRILDAIDFDGNIAQLAVPVDLLDPGAVRFWVRGVLGDSGLADTIATTADVEMSALLAARRAQCASLLAGR